MKMYENKALKKLVRINLERNSEKWKLKIFLKYLIDFFYIIVGV